MIYEEGVWAGTFGEFRNFLTGRIYDTCSEGVDFRGYDIGFCHTAEDVSAGARALADDVCGWYGVKSLDAGFDSTASRQFCSDYYGGGDFGCCSICTDDMDTEYVTREVEKMIAATFGCGHGQDICVWEAAG